MPALPQTPIYSAADILTFIAAIGVLLGGLGAVIVNIIVALKTSAAIKENSAITQQALTTAKVIEGHVNSEQTKASEQISALQRENKLLMERISDIRATAQLLAQSQAGTDRDRSQRQRGTDAIAAVAKEDPAAKERLAAIEKNTEETAKNTAPGPG